MGQTKFSSLRQKFRQYKPSSVLLVGGSDGANQVQFIDGASILLVSTLLIFINFKNLYFLLIFYCYGYERDARTSGGKTLSNKLPILPLKNYKKND